MMSIVFVFRVGMSLLGWRGLAVPCSSMWWLTTDLEEETEQDLTEESRDELERPREVDTERLEASSLCMT